jgi:homoserine O-acetyltransferase/O-succinyltransferase
VRSAHPGPTSINPVTNRPYRLSFPRYTMRDVVEVQKHLIDMLEVTSFKSVLGSLRGGMQVLEFKCGRKRVSAVMIRS